MCSLWSSVSPRFPFIKNRKFFKRRHSWSTINFAVFSWYWPALFCALNTPKSALYRPDDPSQLLALVDFLLVFILYLSFSQKPHHLRDNKFWRKNFWNFEESKLQFRRSSKSRSRSFLLFKETKESRKREFRRAAKHRNFESIKYRKTYNRQRNNN